MCRGPAARQIVVGAASSPKRCCDHPDEIELAEAGEEGRGRRDRPEIDAEDCAPKASDRTQILSEREAEQEPADDGGPLSDGEVAEAQLRFEVLKGRVHDD